MDLIKKGNKTYIIAEVGPNHNGSLQLALEIIDKLSSIGVDAIKFQKSNPELLWSDDSILAKYQENKDIVKTPQEMSKKYQLTYSEHMVLYQKCIELKVDYLCTAFDLESLKFFDNNIDLKYYKIASGEIFSLDIIDYISEKQKSIILSTGMATYDEIGIAIDLLNRNFKKDITILHCISNYPTPYNNVNMNVMLELKKRFGYPVGFSDHTIGNESSITAVALGACIIEKHVTLDRNLPGPDHQASSTIEEFKEMVKSIRKVEKIMGNPINKVSSQEREIAEVARKSIVSKSSIPKGIIITEKDICYKRPGTGYLPIEKKKVIGKKTTKRIPANKVITKDFFKND